MSREVQDGFLETTQNDNGTITRSRASRLLYIATVTCLLGGAVDGTFGAWPTVALHGLSQNDSVPFVNEQDSETRSLIGSLYCLGGGFGCLLAGTILERYGRKRVLIVSVIPIMAAWALIIWSTGVAALFAGRFLGGLAGGFMFSSIPIYLTEISLPTNRGLLGSGTTIMLTVGQFYTVICGTFLDWKYTSVACLLPLVAILFVMPFMPESPIWLAGRGESLAAKEALIDLRQHRPSSHQAELVLIEQSFVRRKSSLLGSYLETTCRKWRRPDAYKPLVFCLLLAAFQQLSGVTALVFYQRDIFRAGKISVNENYATIFIFGIQMLCTALAGSITDHLGRKPLFILGGTVQALSLTLLGLYYKYQDTFTNYGLELLPVFCLTLFFAGYSFGQGPVTWSLIGELSPNFVRSQVASISASGVWFTAFIVTRNFASLQESLGMNGTFWLHSVMVLIAVLYVALVLPETKGKTLDWIQVWYK